MPTIFAICKDIRLFPIIIYKEKTSCFIDKIENKYPLHTLFSQN